MCRRGWLVVILSGLTAIILATTVVVVLKQAAIDRLPSDLIASGRYSPAHAIPVSNLTVDAGSYRAGFTANVYFSPQKSGSTLRCYLIDTSGRIEFHSADSEPRVKAGKWTRITFETTLDLPDLTLGFRCKPSSDEGVTVVFRSLEVYADSDI
jgi:hypothetical protein